MDIFIRLKIFRLMLIIVAILWSYPVNSQVVSETSISELLDKLKTVDPIAEKLKVDTFPNFDFNHFKPISDAGNSTGTRYLVGSANNVIRTVTIIIENEVIGTMNIYDFKSFKIIIFKKREAVIGSQHDGPIFCVGQGSRYAIYLGKPFHFHQTYKPKDIIGIHVLRDDLFPVWILTIRDGFIRMLTEVKYVNGGSRQIDHVTLMVVFQAENDKKLLISGSSKFSTDLYVPASDVVVSSKPKLERSGFPLWLDASDFHFE